MRPRYSSRPGLECQSSKLQQASRVACKVRLINGLDEFYNLLWYGQVFGFLVSMKAEVPRVESLWSLAIDDGGSSCDGWCSVDEIYGGFGNFHQESSKSSAASWSLRESSMLIRLESPPRCSDQILKCQSFAVAPLFWDPVVIFTSQDSVAFTVLSCSKFRVMSHINRDKLCEICHPKRRPYKSADPVLSCNF